VDSIIRILLNLPTKLADSILQTIVAAAIVSGWCSGTGFLVPGERIFSSKKALFGHITGMGYGNNEDAGEVGYRYAAEVLLEVAFTKRYPSNDSLLMLDCCLTAWTCHVGRLNDFQA
jgi:hypothetical protein